MRRPQYHRAYRHLLIHKIDIGWGIAFGLLPNIILLLAAPLILRLHGVWVIALLEWIGVPVSERITYFGRLPMVIPDVPSYAPSRSLYPAVVAVAGIVVGFVLLLALKRLTPLRVIAGIAALTSGISGSFFYFAGDRFPHTALDFAEVWTRAEFVVWMIIPILLAILLGTLPLPPRIILLFSGMTLLYAIWFSAIRLTLFLTLFHFAGLIWLPVAYFLGGFLLDFIYVVSYYSLAISRTTKIVRERREVWAW